jgi:hypothetical protein
VGILALGIGAVGAVIEVVDAGFLRRAPGYGALAGARAGVLRGALVISVVAGCIGRGSRHARLRSALLMLEVSLSVVLLVGAGLLSRSLRRVASVDPGFVPAGVLAADVPLAAARGPDKASQLRVAQDALRRLRADPLVDSAGFVSRLPFSSSNTVGDLALPGRESEAFPCDLRLASDGHFETLRMPLREGRTFSEADLRGEGPPAVTLNQEAARRAFAGGSAVGQRVLVWADTVPSEVVGVATAAKVMAELMRETMARVGVGCCAGVAAAAALAHALRGFLFGVAPADGETFGAFPLLLAATALVATLLGSIRVTRLDPASALRQ